MEREQRTGLHAAIVAYIVWGLLTIYWKQLADLDPFDLVGWRVASAAVVMCAVMAITGTFGRLRPAFRHGATLANVVVASVLLTVNWSTYVWAVSNEHVIDTALGYFLAPLGTVAIGVLVLGERLSWLKLASIVCALAAIVVLLVSYGAVPWVALILAVTWASYGFVKRRVLLDPVASLTAELLVLIVPALVIVGLSFTRSDGVPNEAHGIEWPLVLGTGVITAVPLLLFAYAAQRVPFTILGPTNYLIPIINFLLGWLAFGEPLPPSRTIGFVLIWLALTFATVDTLRSDRPKIRSSGRGRSGSVSADLSRTT